MSNKVRLKEVRRIRDIKPFVDTIYKNFSYLADSAQLGHNREEIVRLLKTRDMFSLFVYDDKGMMIGYLVGEFKTLNDGRYVYYISYLFVAPKYRKKKVATQLMGSIINKCKDIGIKYILLTCDIRDRRVTDFYKKLGFMPDPLLKNNSNHEVMTLYI